MAFSSQVLVVCGDWKLIQNINEAIDVVTLCPLRHNTSPMNVMYVSSCVFGNWLSHAHYAYEQTFTCRPTQSPRSNKRSHSSTLNGNMFEPLNNFTIQITWKNHVWGSSFRSCTPWEKLGFQISKPKNHPTSCFNMFFAGPKNKL